jgi:hypothetical protein
VPRKLGPVVEIDDAYLGGEFNARQHRIWLGLLVAAIALTDRLHRLTSTSRR